MQTYIHLTLVQLTNSQVEPSSDARIETTEAASAFRGNESTNIPTGKTDAPSSKGSSTQNKRTSTDGDGGASNKRKKTK